MRGGRRSGAGRPIGAATKRIREIADRAAEEGVLPLEYMLAVLRDENADPARRDDMARSAAPYLHPRLSTAHVDAEMGVSDDLAALLGGLRRRRE